MKAEKYHRQALMGMPMSQLRELAAAFDPPIHLVAKESKARIVKKIIEREDREASSHAVSPPQGAGPGDVGPPRPDFEAAVKTSEAEATERRGGPRKGAGRPLGMTDEKAAVKNLPKQPNMAIRQGVYVLGQAWAASVKIPAVAFDDDETDLIALPLSQLQEYYFPGLIPEIAAVWVSLAYGLAKVVKVRLDLIREVQAARKEGKNVETVIGNGDRENKSGCEKPQAGSDHNPAA